MRNAFRILLAAALIALASASWDTRSEARTYENARAVGKRCSTCHTSAAPHLANLNEAGKYYLTRRTLDGFTPAAPRRAARPRAQEGSSPSGRAIYEKSCAVCHGPKGEGTQLAKSLTGPRKDAATESAAVAVIRDGIPGTTMAPFKSALSDQQIRDVAKYVMTLSRR